MCRPSPIVCVTIGQTISLLAVITALLACCSSCVSKNHALAIYKGVAMTMPYTVIVNASSSLPSVDSIINDTFFTIDHLYNKWNSQSEISALNNATDYFQCSKEFYTMLKYCETFVTLSGGLFDPTIERLEQVWKNALDQGSTPTPTSLQEISKKIGWSLLEFDESGLVHKIHPEVQLDLGGIAKGYTIDLLTSNIQKCGYTNIFVEWGGEVKTIGGHPDGRPWRVGIKNPMNPDEILTIIYLFEGSIATRGDYQPSWIAQDQGIVKQFLQMYNPESLYPVETTANSLTSVSIQHESCMVADAIASILLAIGNKEPAVDFFEENILPRYPTASYYMVGRGDSSPR